MREAMLNEETILIGLTSLTLARCSGLSSVLEKVEADDLDEIDSVIKITYWGACFFCFYLSIYKVR